MSNSRWAPRETAAPFVPAPQPAQHITTPPPSRQSAQHPASPAMRGQPHIVSISSASPNASARQDMQKKVNTWDKYKYKADLDIPLAFNENVEGRQVPSRLPAAGTVPKHDAKGLTGSAASRWAPKHVVDQALREKEAEESGGFSSEDDAKTSTSTTSVVAPSMQTLFGEAPTTPEAAIKPSLSTVDEPAGSVTPMRADPLEQVDGLYSTLKAENEKRSAPALSVELPDLLSRLSVPDDKVEKPKAATPNVEDSWMIGASFKPHPQEPLKPSTPPPVERPAPSTPSGGHNWADDDDDDEEDIKALMAKEWGVASVAKVEAKNQTLVTPAPNEVIKVALPLAPASQGMSIRGQAPRHGPQQTFASPRPNQGVELFPGPPATNKEGPASPRRARPQVAKNNEAFARLSRGFMGGGEAGSGARTRGKRSGKDAVKESGT